MHKIIFKCEVITPMFCGGSDNSKAELRVQSIKGLLRFWWRAIRNENDPVKLLKAEGKIFGSTDDKIGASKCKIKIKDDRLESEEKLGIYLKMEEKTSKKGKKYFNPSNNTNGIFYLLYSVINPNKEGKFKTFIKEKEKNIFKITFISPNLNILKNYIAAFWCLVNLGGIGARVRRGAGSFRVISVIDEENILKDTGLDFIKKINTQNELAEYLKATTNKIFNIINEEGNKNFIYTHSNLSFSRIRISNKDFDNWDSCLNDIGVVFKDFRTEHKGEVFDTPCFGFPIRHKDGTEFKSKKYKRRASPLIFKIYKTHNNKYYWIALRISGEFLPEGITVDKIKNKTLLRSQKYNYKLLDEFWKELQNQSREYLLSIPKKLTKILDEIKREIDCEQIILIGSKARGDFRKKSDIDLVIKTKDNIEKINIIGAVDIIDFDKAQKYIKEKIKTEGVNLI